jgi:hypothetical protein
LQSAALPSSVPGASMAGAKKQGDASKNAANLQMQQFDRINAQQQPFIQSGYGAQQRLNTLLGINANPYGRSGGAPMHAAHLIVRSAGLARSTCRRRKAASVSSSRTHRNLVTQWAYPQMRLTST